MLRILLSKFSKKYLRIINFLKSSLNRKSTLNSTLENAKFIFFGLILLFVITLYLLAPFNSFLLKLLLFVKIITFLLGSLAIFLVKDKSKSKNQHFS